MPQLSNETMDLFPDAAAAPASADASEAYLEHSNPQPAAVSTKPRARGRERNESRRRSTPDKHFTSAGHDAIGDTTSDAVGPHGGAPVATGALPAVALVPLHLIEASPINPRPMVRDDDHRSLVESLRAHGQDRTISVFTDGDRFRIRTGTRLWLAATEAGLTEIRAEVYPPASPLEELRRIAREDSQERPRSAFEKARLAGMMRAVLGATLGREPTVRELAPELNLQIGATCERLRVYDCLTAEVIEMAGVSLEELVSASHTALHTASTKKSPKHRAAWLHRTIRGVFPEWWDSEREHERRVRLVARTKPDGGFELNTPDPETIPPDQAVQILNALAAYVESLRRRAGQADN